MSAGFVERARLGNIYVARMAPGDDLHTGISRLADIKGERRMVILSAVGSLSEVLLRNLATDADLPIAADDWQTREERGPCELLALTGNLFPLGGDPILHVHATLGLPDGTVIGGHLDSAVVFSSVEIFFVGIDRSWAVKSPNEETGLAELGIASERRARL